jgi:hypothetical protein
MKQKSAEMGWGLVQGPASNERAGKTAGRLKGPLNQKF